jgi:hypothetical protein
MTHKVGQPVQYCPESTGNEPLAAQVTKAHDDGTVCLVYWCTATKAHKEAFNVPHLSDSDADRNEDYFLCLGEADTVDLGGNPGSASPP